MTDTIRKRHDATEISGKKIESEHDTENHLPYSASISSSKNAGSSYIRSEHASQDSSSLSHHATTNETSEENSHQETKPRSNNDANSSSYQPRTCKPSDENSQQETKLIGNDDTNSSSAQPRTTGSKVSVQLLHRTQLPHHLQFNPYIDTGYRPLLSSWECLKSLFYLHNETVNIITHGVPMLYILVMWSELLPWHEVTVPVLPWTHLLSCLSPWVGSTIYHLFMNHEAGEHCYRSLLHLDMFGIWITQSFGALTTVYASVSCLGAEWVWRVLGGYCLVSLWCLYKASHARNPWERRFCFTLPFLMRAAAVLVRLSPLGGGDPLAFRHIVLQDLLAVVGGFIGAFRIPEKWLPPNSVDLVANSHHIMHVVVVWAVYHLHQGATLDLVWLSRNKQCPGLMTD